VTRADDGCRLWTASTGRGAPLIVCHGGQGWWDMFGSLASALASPLSFPAVLPPAFLAGRRGDGDSLGPARLRALGAARLEVPGEFASRVAEWLEQASS
jgi:hypothetical protein